MHVRLSVFVRTYYFMHVWQWLWKSWEASTGSNGRDGNLIWIHNFCMQLSVHIIHRCGTKKEESYKSVIALPPYHMSASIITILMNLDRHLH